MYSSAHHHHNKAVTAPSPESAAAADIFEQLCAASTFKSILHHYRHLCDVLKLKPTNIRHFYPKLKTKLRSWKAQAIWSKFDKRSSHKPYNHGKACPNTKVFIIGAGPCGLRTAIECQLLGAKVVVVEKRDRFSRNNVLHLWPFVISDLKLLGAKKFYGKFCAGAIDHISIRQLQCILLKVALLLGVEVIENVSFEELLEPPEDQTEKIGWRARLSPPDHPANQYEFDVLVGADGKRNTLAGFRRKEFRGKLAIAITANFINKRSELEARVQEISGVAFIFNQKFFKELYAATGIDLENIVYYKDETHYFVMTAKKHSLLNKGVILQDLPDTQELLHQRNVDSNALQEYAREAADFSTNYQLPHLDFAVNHYGKPDIAMFDFTSMFAAENACRMLERRGHKLISALVGDSLLEPFWPTGSGCARGFLSCFDCAWMIRTWASEKASPLEVLAERESIYRLLAQTTPENLNKDHSSYTIEPMSRYPTINTRTVLPFQVRTLFNTDDPSHLEEITNPHLVSNEELPKKRKRRDSFIHPDTLLIWLKKQLALYSTVRLDNMTTSFKDGRAFCAIIHRYRPDLIDFDSINPENVAQNNQQAFDILEREFGIPPVMTGAEMADCDVPDKLSMISYASQIYDVFRGEIPHYKYPKIDDGEIDANMTTSSGSRLNILKNLTNNSTAANLASKKRPTERGALTREEALITCRLLDNDDLLGDKKGDSLKKTKKRRSDKVLSLDKEYGDTVKAHADYNEDFKDKVKDLEAKFIGSSHSSDKRPKDMIRRVGKIEKGDWNMAAIEKKIHDSVLVQDVQLNKEKVPKWSKEVYEDKFQHIERRLRENGEDEETIAKYKDIDASLKRLEMKLREGSTLETGLRGHNKVSNLASQLSSKLTKKEAEKIIAQEQSKPTRPTVPLPSSGSDLCHFCGNRVYLVERLSAEGKFFHRQCFKCDYCAANLRLGNYIYDRDGRYGGKFFCIPHYGLSPRERIPRRKIEDTDSAKENIVPTSTSLPTIPSTPHLNVPGAVSKGDAAYSIQVGKGGKTPVTLSPEDRARGTTPERVEFENSVVEQSDEDEYLSEEEWTDRNFGASANELDNSDGDDEDSDFSDLSDEEADDVGMEFIEGRGTLTAAETRRLAESWQRRYSTDILDDDDPVFDHESESDLDSDNYSEEYGAEGDDSHTATEGEGGEDDDEEEGEAVKRARELRRMEVNIDVAAPPRKAETSDSGSETEVASDEETDESDTQIDTDSEFADDHVQPGPPKSIPTIVIDESQEPHQDEHPIPVIVKEQQKESKNSVNIRQGEPKPDLIAQRVDLGKTDRVVNKNVDWNKDNEEKSASLSNLNDTYSAEVRAEQLKRLLQRTESTEAIAAKKALQLKRQYLLGDPINPPRKSVSTADLGNRFKSFMDKISETQKMLNPAPQPSAAMQAYMNTSSSPKTPTSSPSSPLLPARSISLPQGDSSQSSTKEKQTSSSSGKDTTQEDITTHIDSSVCPVEAIDNSLKNKSTDSPLQGFPVTTKELKEALNVEKVSEGKLPSSESSSTETITTSSNSESDYDNVPSGHKHSIKNKSATVVEIGDESGVSFGTVSKVNEITTSSAANSFTNIISDISTCDIEKNVVSENVVNEYDKKQKYVSDKEKEINILNASKDSEELDNFGFSLPSQSNESVETINKELIKVNAPNSLELISNNYQENTKDKSAVNIDHILELNSHIESQDNVDELFDKLANEAISDDKFVVLEDTNKITNKESISDKNILTSGEINTGFISSDPLSEKVSDIKESKTIKTTECNDIKSEPNVQIIVAKYIEAEAQEPFHSDLLSKTSFEGDNLRNKNLSKNESISSPDAKENTEAELSDWAGDNDIISAGEDLEVEVNEDDRYSSKKYPVKNIARIASIESLGDTDSALSSGPPKTTTVPSKPCTLGDLDGIEYMDSSESASSPEEQPLRQQGYSKLEEETPTTPVAPQLPSIGFEKFSMVDPQQPPLALIGFEKFTKEDWEDKKRKSSGSTSSEMDEDTTPSSVQECLKSNTEKHCNSSSQGNDQPANNSTKAVKSMSEPPSLSDNKPKLNGETQRRDSLDDYMSSKRYEGYIPRFKERMSPFGYVRDSLDVKKGSNKEAGLYTPTQNDIEERKLNEKRLAKESQILDSNESNIGKSVVSPNTAKKQIEKSLKNKNKEKEKDLIKEMVLSRISHKTPEREARRAASRTSNSPLSSTSSRTSLLSPRSSQENLIDKVEPKKKNKDENEPSTPKKTISANSKALLRFDTIRSDLPESGQTFAAEENRSKVKVGQVFKQDSVLGNFNVKENQMSKSLDSSLLSNLPESGETFTAEEGRSKVKVGGIFRDDSVLGDFDRNTSIHEEDNVPFADDSLDEEVFERKGSSKRIHLGISSKNYIGRKGKDQKLLKNSDSTEPPSPTHSNLPATPLTHPDQFNKKDPKRELFQSDMAPITPVRRNRPNTSKGHSTPINSERPLSTPNLSTVDREKAREEARSRARQKTDIDLGLSPPNLADSLRGKLNKGSVSESESNKKDNIKDGPPREKQTNENPHRKEESHVKDREERVKELLAEQREHRMREPASQEEWSTKDDRIRERLEEYRQKRKEGIKTTENNDTPSNNKLLRRPTHRPSLLELESLQVFTSSPSKSSPLMLSASTSAIVSSSNSGLSNTNLSTSPSADKTSMMSRSSGVLTSSSCTNIPDSHHPSQETVSEKAPEKKSGKKSKDRERRRSLIQVFTGMFSKSDDKKKNEQQDNGEVAVSPKTNPSQVTSTSVTNVSQAENHKNVPKSPPSTVKDKFSRLRLSRSKDKKKAEKGRSTSADVLDHRETAEESRAAFSLPTSPSRHPLPSLISPMSKTTPPQASGTNCSSSQVRHTTPRIEEESLSDEEGESTSGTPKGTLDRGLQAPWLGSSTRKRNAALKMARQAELKRLRMAQEIQRQLEECEVKTRELEERGVAVEKALRGENDGANRDESDLIGDWFAMVHEKNALVRWEQELMVRAKELELEDRHVRLEHELRHRMALSEHEKSRQDIDREGTILAEMLNILEQKDQLVTMLEEDRQRYLEEDRDLETVMLRKGLQFSPLRRETGV